MYRKILIATDGTELAGRALTHALALAKSVGASATVVTVTELWSALDVLRRGDGDAQRAIKEYESFAADYAGRTLAAAAEQAKAAGVGCETRHVSDRHPSDGILDAARDAGCDLIVMSSHGRRGLDRLLLGSEAQEVLARSEIPVLIVR